VIRDLRRNFDRREAVRGLSFEIAEGEIFGLLGPNGAGKTTTISMVSTRIRPTRGEVWIFGKHVQREVNAARRLLNVAPQEEALYPSLTGEENLYFFARLYGVPREEREAQVEEVLELVGLTTRKDDRVSSYSGGMRRRLNFGCALVSRPRLLLLDEPTVGVDPQSRAHIFDAVRTLRARGLTILYTTHYLQEAEALCDRIAIMDEGRLVALGTLSELLARSHAQEVIELKLAEPPGDIGAVARLEGVLRLELAGTELRVFTSRAQRVLAKLCGTPSLLDQPILTTKVAPITLENVFMELTGKELRD
jgi:ABC-2 type transport system ATP-binding protein